MDWFPLVPKKVAKARKDGHQHAQDDDDDNILLLDRKPSAVTKSSSQILSPSKAKEAEKGKPADDSETEDEESDSGLLLNKENSRNPLPTPARSLSPAGSLDPQIDEGRIIGRTHPLKDFKTNLSRGDVVTKAVEDLSAVITEIVMRPFANRRKDEMMECMKAMRDTCLKVG